MDLSPLVVYNMVFAGSQDGNLHVLLADNGLHLWSYQADDKIISSPAELYGQIYVASLDHHIYALDTSGDVAWKFKTGGEIWSSPTIWTSPKTFDNYVYVGSNDDHIYAVDAFTGELRWKHGTGGDVLVSALVADGKLYAASADGQLYALDAESGELNWMSSIGQGTTSRPAEADGIVYVGSWDGRVYALDAETGDPSWTYETGDRVFSSPAVADGVVFVVSDDGFVYALDAGSGSAALEIRDRWKGPIISPGGRRVRLYRLPGRSRLCPGRRHGRPGG